MMAKNKGVAAIVIDGMARDSDGIVPRRAAGVRARHHAQLLRAQRARQGRPADRVRRRGGAAGRCRARRPRRRGGDPAGAAGDVVAALDEIRRMEEETQEKIRAGMTHLASIAELLKSDKRRLRRLTRRRVQIRQAATVCAGAGIRQSRAMWQPAGAR